MEQKKIGDFQINFFYKKYWYVVIAEFHKAGYSCSFLEKMFYRSRRILAEAALLEYFVTELIEINYNPYYYLKNILFSNNKINSRTNSKWLLTSRKISCTKHPINSSIGQNLSTISECFPSEVMNQSLRTVRTNCHPISKDVSQRQGSKFEPTAFAATGRQRPYHGATLSSEGS